VVDFAQRRESAERAAFVDAEPVNSLRTLLRRHAGFWEQPGALGKGGAAQRVVPVWHSHGVLLTPASR
jgi:hypothetical protein